jgi:hypothetical protein
MFQWPPYLVPAQKRERLAMRVNLKFLPDTENVTWITKAQIVNITVKIQKKMHKISRNIWESSQASINP